MLSCDYFGVHKLLFEYMLSLFLFLCLSNQVRTYARGGEEEASGRAPRRGEPEKL